MTPPDTSAATDRARRQQALLSIERRLLGWGVGSILCGLIGIVALPILADRAFWLFPAVLGAWFTAAFTGSLVLGRARARVFGEHLDAECRALGLSGAPRMVHALYRGEWARRPLTISYIAGRGRHDPSRLLVRLGTPLRSRLMFRAAPVAVGRAAGLEEIAGGAHGLDALRVWCAERPWAEAVLDTPAAREALSVLVPQGPKHQLDLRPDGLLLRIRAPAHDEIVSEQLEAWLRAMEALLSAAEGVAAAPPPAEQALTLWERRKAVFMSPEGEALATRRWWAPVGLGLATAAIIVAVALLISSC